MDQSSLSHGARLIQKYPDRVPIVVTDPDKVLCGNPKKFMVPGNFSLHAFMSLLRQRSNISHREGLFLLVGSTLKSANPCKTLSQIHRDDADANDILRMVLKKESVFGSTQLCWGVRRLFFVSQHPSQLFHLFAMGF